MEGSSKHVVQVREDDDKLDVKKQKSGEQKQLTREERFELFLSNFKRRKELEDYDKIILETKTRPDGKHPITFREMASMDLDIYETDGFDVHEIRNLYDGSVIKPFYNRESGLGAKYLPDISDCAKDAILHYNQENGKMFEFMHVIKANVEPLATYRYYITFVAREQTSGESTETNFQAIVNVRIPTTKRTIVMVRIEQPPRLFSL